MSELVSHRQTEEKLNRVIALVNRSLDSVTQIATAQ